MRSRTFKSLAAVVAVIAVTTLAACTDNTAPYTQTVGGSYSLQTVNGTFVPYSYSSGSNTVTIESDFYRLNNDGTYNETINEIIDNGYTTTSANDAEAGNWSQNGNAVVFAPNYSTQGNYSQYTGSLTGGGTFSHSSLTFSYNGVVWMYNHT